MRSLSPMLASLASAFKPPISQSASRPSIPILNHAAPSSILGLGSLPSTRPFSATASLGKKKEKVKPDKRVSTYPSHPHPQSKASIPQPIQPTNKTSPNPLLPPPPQNAASTPVLSQPLPPPLDDPPGVAPVPGATTPGARKRAAATVAGDECRV